MVDKMITKIDENTLKVTDVDKLIETLDELRLSAKDMFEMLGYKQEVFKGWYINYYKELEENLSEEIYFSYKNKGITARIVDLRNEIELDWKIITLDELTAINKQIEELGW